MIGTLAIVTALLIATGALLHVRSSQRTYALVENEIRSSIESKGSALVNYHALALRGLVADNAFGDVRRLVEAARRDNPQIAYGLFLDNELNPWVYTSPTDTKDDSPNHWREIGIGSEFLTSEGPRSARRQLFGQDVFEFSAPVLGEDGQRLGVVVYGLWAGPLENALRNARQESRTVLFTSVGLLSALTVASLILGWLLVQRAAERITRPLADLTRATTALAAGNRQLQVTIRSQDELEELGDSFNRMVGELNESYASLESLNRTLEQRVEDRTHELADKNRDLRLVLDTVNEGLLTVSRDGWLAQGRSAMIDRWFGSWNGPTLAVDYFTQVNPIFAQLFALGFEALLDDVLPMEVSLSQMPARLQHQGRDFLFNYLPIQDGDRLTGLLVAVNDVTEQLALAHQEAQQRELLALFQGMRDRLVFLAFFDEATQQVEQIVGGTHDLATQRRLVHTLKGNASSASLNVIARLCHVIEDELDESQGAVITPTVITLGERWKALQTTLAHFTGDVERGAIEIEASEMERLQQDIARGLAGKELLARLQSFRCTPVAKLFGRLAEQAQSLATRLGRDELQIDVEDRGLRLDLQRWGPLFAELIHLVRNAVDHGIEPREERHSRGKPTQARLRFSVSCIDDTLAIEVEDDGRGIDWEAIRRSARARGLPADTLDDLQTALFSPGVSARAQVSDTSGRGIGMSALRQRVRDLGGTISLTSRARRGTLWRLSFPLSPAAAPTVAGLATSAHLPVAIS
jgi:HAMP domain-containing protein/HPt (histidine-containing phosphotransfer) domain-containing protein